MNCPRRGSKAPKRPGWLNGSDGRELAVRLVKGDRAGDVDVADAVAVGAAERCRPRGTGDPLDPAAGHGVEPGFDQRHVPGLGFVAMDLHAVGAQVEGHVGVGDRVVDEEVLDDLALVAAADDEVVDAVSGSRSSGCARGSACRRSRPSAWGVCALFADAGAEAAGENDCFHERLFFDDTTTTCASLVGWLPSVKNRTPPGFARLSAPKITRRAAEPL